MNRSHRNSGHRTMNRLAREGRAHSSQAIEPAPPRRTTHQVIIADVNKALRAMPDQSIDLAICDPPYNLAMADWDSLGDYLGWAKTWLNELIRVLTPHGSLVLFGGLQYQADAGGDLLDLMAYLRREAPVRLVNLIVWNYANGMSAHRFFASRHEEIAWYAKGPKYVFNLDAVREPFTEQQRAAYARDRRLRPESLAKGKNPTNVWRIGRLNANARERTGHPTQKPRAIYDRIIRALSRTGATVLDPFAGSGVCARVAIELGRHSISIDRDSAIRKHLDRQLADLPSTKIPYALKAG